MKEPVAPGLQPGFHFVERPGQSEHTCHPDRVAQFIGGEGGQQIHDRIDDAGSIRTFFGCHYAVVTDDQAERSGHTVHQFARLEADESPVFT